MFTFISQLIKMNPADSLEWLRYDKLADTYTYETSCYTDVNGKDWIVIFDHSQIRLLDHSDLLENKKCHICFNYRSFLAMKHKVNVPTIVFTASRSPSYVIDTDNHVLYLFWSDRHLNGRHVLINIDIYDWNNPKLLDVKDLRHQFNDTITDLQMTLTTQEIHFIPGKCLSQLQHCAWNIKTKSLRAVRSDMYTHCSKDTNFWSANDDKASHMHGNSTLGNCNNFIKSLRVGSLIDCKDKMYGNSSNYYPAIIQIIVDKDKANINKWNINHRNKINIYAARTEKNKKNTFEHNKDQSSHGKYVYIKYQGFDSGFDQWIDLNVCTFCDCHHKCAHKFHEFAMPMTQSTFYIFNAPKEMLYSKQYKKLILISIQKSRLKLCFKNVWYDYCHHHQWNINVKQLDYKKTSTTTDTAAKCNSNTQESVIERYCVQLLIFGYLRSNENNTGIRVPMDLYGLIFKYYFQSTANKWILSKHVHVPNCYSCKCVLINNDRFIEDIIIFGGKVIFRYNINKDELIEIKHVVIPKFEQSFIDHAVYSDEKQQIYLFAGKQCLCIDVARLSRKHSQAK